MIDKKVWTAQLHDDVMFGDKVCPFCEGAGRVYRTPAKSFDDSYSCDCEELKWKRRVIERILPLRYQRNNIWTLEPSTASKLPLERQRFLIDFMKQPENRDKGYLLFGKTTLATCLVRHAIERDWNDWFFRPRSHNIPGALKWNNDWIRYINWDNLIGEYMAYQNDRDAEPPTISAAIIKKVAESGRRPVLCIEELDKSRLTEYKANKLFDIVQAVDANKGQLIITTNYRTLEEFEAFLYKTDNESINLAGEPVWRRIVDNCKAIKFEKEGEL
jgi:DNA replication protein DnaC